MKYWGDCVLTTIYLINSFPSVLLGNISPFEKLHATPPFYDHLKSLGCLCYAITPKPHRDKLQPRSVSSIFLGYLYGKKGYKLLKLSNSFIFYSRDIKFYEHVFPYTIFLSSIFPFPLSLDFFVYESTHVSHSPISSIPDPTYVVRSANSPLLCGLLRRSTKISHPLFISETKFVPLFFLSSRSISRCLLLTYTFMSLNFTSRLFPILPDRSPCNRHLKILSPTTLGIFFLFHLIRKISLLSGCIRSNRGLMALLRGIRPD